ncbi:MAG: hypothetical protein CXR31_02080 [Geobacter sp.]|nr:MAG: hypothetical protein CXR31_02080 [Geobacter sp.]
MNLLIIVILIGIIIVVLAVLKTKQPSIDNGLTFERREPLFSPAERSFLGVLEQSLDKRYRVFGKVRLGDIVKPAKGLSSSKRTTAQNKINQKHLDYVVCSAAELTVVGIVELDDQTHGREDRATRDDFVDQSLASAKIPVARFSAKRGYSLQEVRTKLVEAFKLADEFSEQIPVKKDHPSTQPPPLTVADQNLTQPEEIVPTCPKCAASMVKRQAKNGPHAGNFFWACSTYPKCRQVIAIAEN